MVSLATRMKPIATCSSDIDSLPSDCDFRKLFTCWWWHQSINQLNKQFI